MLMSIVTLLSIFACDSIAIPLSSSFPASELRYILQNSEAATLLASEKFRDKAEEVLKEGLENVPALYPVEKRLKGTGEDEITLVSLPATKGGMMLYTSGTTSRPVCCHCLHSRSRDLTFHTERRRSQYQQSHRTGAFTQQSLEI